MIIIDRDIGRRVYNNIFGHESLKAIIEYLNLKKVKDMIIRLYRSGNKMRAGV